MRHHLAVASVMPASTSRTLSPQSVSPPATSRGNVFIRFARRLIEADAQARDRRHLRDLPDHLCADVGLPPRSDAERAIADLCLRIALSGRS